MGLVLPLVGERVVPAASAHGLLEAPELVAFGPFGPGVQRQDDADRGEDDAADEHCELEHPVPAPFPLMGGGGGDV